MSLSYNYYWPYAVNEEIVRYTYFTCLARTLVLPDGSTYFFGNVEIYENPIDHTISMIYYFCCTEPHTHQNLPSCSRFVLCFPPEVNDTVIP